MGGKLNSIHDIQMSGESLTITSSLALVDKFSPHSITFNPSHVWQ